MGKTIGLKQLAQKVYQLVEDLPPDIQLSIGKVEDAFDAIIYGNSGHGKTNFTVMLLKALLKALPHAKAEYVAYEEGHGQTVQELMIKRHNMLEEVGNRLAVTEHLTAAELKIRMAKKQSAKIWVIDSLQASGLSYKDCKDLKERFVLTRKKKILIYVSWSDGKLPSGACAKSVEYYANIKMRVHDLVMFPKSRYGGNEPFIIWEEGARKRWGRKYRSILKSKTTEKLKSNTHESHIDTDSTEPVDPVIEHHSEENSETL